MQNPDLLTNKLLSSAYCVQNIELDKTKVRKRMSCPWGVHTLPERHDMRTGSQLGHPYVKATPGGVKSLGTTWERMLLGQIQLLPPVSPEPCISQLGDPEACPPASVLSCVCLVWVCLTSTFLAGCSARAGTIHESLCHFLLAQSPPSSRLLVPT